MNKTKIAFLLATLTMGLTSNSFAQQNKPAPQKEEAKFNAAATLNPNSPFGYIYLYQEDNKFQKTQPAPEMLKKIQSKYPLFKATSVTYLPDVKLYEILSDTTAGFSYTNEDISYFIINGELVDANRFTDVSKERNKKFIANFVKENSKPEEIQLILGDPNAKNRRHIIIFSDPDCPFCKGLDKDIHQNLKNQNLTITYLMNPLYELPGHEEAPLKAAKLWCAPNKNKAWENWMLVGELPNNDGSCKNPTKEHANFARRYNLLMTPTILFDNGYSFKGQSTTDELLKILNSSGVRPDVK